MMGLDEIIAANNPKDETPANDNVPPSFRKLEFAVDTLRKIAECPAEHLMSDPPTAGELALYVAVTSAVAAVGVIDGELTEAEAEAEMRRATVNAMHVHLLNLTKAREEGVTDAKAA